MKNLVTTIDDSVYLDIFRPLLDREISGKINDIHEIMMFNMFFPAIYPIRKIEIIIHNKKISYEEY